MTQFSFHNLISIIVNNCNSYLLLSTVNREVGCENISDDKKKKSNRRKKISFQDSESEKEREREN